VEQKLSPTEVRVLGSLIEKQVATPEYYPLTMNALVNACNQLTNREPVVQYDEHAVARALESLREKQLVWVVTQAGSRVPKYEQRLTESLSLTAQEIAVLCLLMLRGPQTSGELRARAARLYEFKELEEVELTLQSLGAVSPNPLVTKLPRQPGMKESRFAHLLSGEVAVEAPNLNSVRVEPAIREVRAENERIGNLEQRMETLEQQVSQLARALDDFKKQFE